MIQKVEMYQAVCDGCGRIMESDICDCAEDTFFSEGKAFEEVFERDWRVFPSNAVTFNKRFEVHGEYKLYCPNCVEYDPETDSYKPKKKKQ